MKWMDGHEECPLKKDDLNRIHKSMFMQQSRWKQNWKEIRDYINPYLGFFEEDIPNQGDRRDYEMINTTPIMANHTQAAGMQNGITSPTRPWMRLTISDPQLSEMDEVRYWCDDVTQILLDIFARSNFYDSAIEFYKELGAPGTAAMMILEDDEAGIWCRTFTIGEYAIATDSKGRVKRFARNMKLTVAEMVDMFGSDNCSPSVQQMNNSKNYEQHIKVKHLVLPNPAAQDGKLDKHSKSFLSFYWEDDGNDDNYLEIGGYEEFPIACSRWSVKGADIYGRSPGWYALGDGKTLQNMEEDILTGIKKMIDPPVTAPVDVMSAGGVNTLPNGVTFYQRDMGDNGVRAAYQVQINVQQAEEKKQAIEQSINKHFFVDLFRSMEQIADGTVTATQVREMITEKMSLIGPVLERLQNEFLKPVIDRVFNIAIRNGLLPPPPDAIHGMEIKIEYISVMAQMQKMVGITSIEQLASFVSNMAQANPGVLDKIDFDEMVDTYADMLSVKPSIIVSDDKVQQIRQQRAQQQQAAQAMQAAEQGSNVARNLGSANTGENNALTALMGGPMQ